VDVPQTVGRAATGRTLGSVTTSRDRSDTDPGDDQRAALRARGRAARAAMGPDRRAVAAATIVDRLAALPELADASRVLVTRAIGDELDLLPLESVLAARGATIALPVVDGDRLVPVDLVDGHELRPGWRGIPEPVGPPSDGPIDVVVVPGLVLDRHGDRLGYGGGFFDRFLAGPAAGAVAVGAVFDDQVVERVPTEPHDVTLDAVVTEAGTWRRGRPAP
jgi:5-formyltetrahydrofolate cyclo-ligase